tara:strand:+ start:135 stop:989 length:855 start_codon:yes stop_codon:yes gene_type:complete
MTAFTRQQSQGDWGTLTWEIRSVNHRFLEMSFRMPEQFRGLESSLREMSREFLDRGKVECNLRFIPGEAAATEVAVNASLVKQLLQANGEVASMLTDTHSPRSMELLRWPGVVQVAEVASDTEQDAAKSLFATALKDLRAAREREGKALADVIRERLAGIGTEVAKVKDVMPSILTLQQEKLYNRFTQAKVELEPTRVEQEMVMLAQKIDIAEELDRLNTHIEEFNRVLTSSEAIGRRLDFLSQEMNREANTMGSKSLNTTTSHAVIELKVFIEQIREQVQNIE